MRSCADPDGLLSLTAGYASGYETTLLLTDGDPVEFAPVLFNGRVCFTAGSDAYGEEGTLSYSGDKDGRAEDVFFDLVAGDSAVTINNLQFVAAEARSNLELEISVYEGSYKVWHRSDTVLSCALVLRERLL